MRCAAGATRTASSPYLIDRNINYTNVCVTACKFCAFYRAPKHAEGWSHSMEEILRRCAEAVDLGATQVMLQGGHHPDYGVEYYETLFSSVKAALPAARHPFHRPERDHAYGSGVQCLDR
jgi:2-iminoacetate synthase ThiH